MSTVYKAQLGDNGTYFALKVINRKQKLGAHLTKKDPAFENEYSILKSLNHKNIVHIYSSSFDSIYKSNILVLELADGNLDDYIEKDVSAYQRRSWCIDVLSGLEYLHKVTPTKNCIIHQDLKNSNILVFESSESEESLLKITDFGCSTIKMQNQTTTKLNFIHTRHWVAPEYYRTLKHTTKSDMYSLGMILYGIIIETKLPFKYLEFLKNTEIENFIKDMKVYADILRNCLNENPEIRWTIEECMKKFTACSDQNRVPTTEISNFETKTLFLNRDHYMIDDIPTDPIDLMTADNVNTNFAKLNIRNEDDWIVKIIGLRG